MRFRTVSKGNTIEGAAAPVIGTIRAKEMGELWDCTVNRASEKYRSIQSEDGRKRKAAILANAIRILREPERESILERLMNHMKVTVLSVHFPNMFLAGIFGHDLGVYGLSDWRTLALLGIGTALLLASAYPIFVNWNTKRHIERMSE